MRAVELKMFLGYVVSEELSSWRGAEFVARSLIRGLGISKFGKKLIQVFQWVDDYKVK